MSIDKGLIYSKWDSEILDLDYYKLTESQLDQWDLIQGDIDNLSNDFLIFIRVKSTRFKNIALLLKNNFYISDILVYLTYSIKEESDKVDNCIAHLSQNSQYKAQCLKIIEQEFTIGRIHDDPNLGIKKGQLLYKEWVLNNFRKEETIAYIENGLVFGFVQYIIKEKKLEVSFIVVKKEFGKKGIGTLLINSVKNIARNEGCKTVCLGTQLKNSKAIEFYLKNTFIVRDTHIGLHLYGKKNDF
jgi:ribosomal protein S18 acetylase RimI-like enzyme